VLAASNRLVTTGGFRGELAQRSDLSDAAILSAIQKIVLFISVGYIYRLTCVGADSRRRLRQMSEGVDEYG
jgi:hypothetical protein